MSCLHARSDGVSANASRKPKALSASTLSRLRPLGTPPRYVHRFMARMEDVRGLGGRRAG